LTYFFVCIYLNYGVEVFKYDKTCSEADLLLYSKVAFWLLLVAVVLLLTYVIWAWIRYHKEFALIKLYEACFFHCLICLFIPLNLIVFVWAIVADAKSTNTAGCKSLYVGTWVYVALTIAFVIVEIIMGCCCKDCIIGQPSIPKATNGPVDYES